MAKSVEYDRIIDFLKALDQQLDSEVALYVIGGAAVTLAYAPENRTADIDAVNAPKEVQRLAGPASALAKAHGVYISSLHDITFSAPAGWRERSRIIDGDFSRLVLRVADPLDIVLGKLARLEMRDIEDILALRSSGFVKPDELLKRINDNLEEIKRFPNYRQNTLLLFNEILEYPIAFKRGMAVRA